MESSPLPSGPLPVPVQVDGQDVVIAPPGGLAGAISLSDDFDAPLDDLFVSMRFPAL